MARVLRFVIVFLIGFSFGAGLLLFAEPQQPVCAESVESVFSPDAEWRAVELIGSAQESVWVEMYLFTNTNLRKALLDAAGRGVEVRVLLEPRVDSNFETARFLSERGISVKWAPREFKLVHSKFVVVDGERVLVGSHNWSHSAWVDNREASVIVAGKAAVAGFEKVFESDWANGNEFVV
ncbi:MAG: phospholipase D family protein [Candidatus Micrarchaeota archaeon]